MQQGEFAEGHALGVLQHKLPRRLVPRLYIARNSAQRSAARLSPVVAALQQKLLQHRAGVATAQRRAVRRTGQAKRSEQRNANDRHRLGSARRRRSSRQRRTRASKSSRLSRLVVHTLVVQRATRHVTCHARLVHAMQHTNVPRNMPRCAAWASAKPYCRVLQPCSHAAMQPCSSRWNAKGPLCCGVRVWRTLRDDVCAFGHQVLLECVDAH